MATPLFQNISTSTNNKNVWNFRVTPTHVAYANTLRRLVLTGVETVAFRADMTDTGTTTDVTITKNSTPMTNEMLAHRIGLLPIFIQDPLRYNPDQYVFRLEETNETDVSRDITCSNFTVLEKRTSELKGDNGEQEEQLIQIPTEKFFPPNPLTKDTCLIATFKPTIYGAMSAESIALTARASIGTGRENARFIPVSQCSYIYSRDENIEKKRGIYEKWLVLHKKVSPESLAQDQERAKILEREFETLEAAKCYLTDEKGEPNSFDFTVETVGVLSVPYIIQRACEVGEAQCLKYANLVDKDMDSVTIQPAEARIRGFDMIFTGEDHTLGNLFQTWLDANMVGKGVVTFAGYKIPHPLRDEMLIRIGVDDGKETSARAAIAEAARACAAMFRTWKSEWQGAINSLKRSG